MSDDFTQLKDEEKEKLLKFEQDDFDDPAATQSTNAATQHNNWIAGVILIAIGLIFLATNLAGFMLHNWWALFILIPVAFTFGNAYTDFHENGRLTKKGRGELTSGLILSLIGCTFLFGWNWGAIWPVFLIIGGISALLKARND
ncbi:MAG: hypothetical protein CSA11_01530 [Chloroflexi bacterium]|nr:MAG: hypothetical protein CSA11_01530 [Chloroflexota bacterium]